MTWKGYIALWLAQYAHFHCPAMATLDASGRPISVQEKHFMVAKSFPWKELSTNNDLVVNVFMGKLFFLEILFENRNSYQTSPQFP